MVEIRNTTRISVSTRMLKRICEKIFAAENRRPEDLSVALVGEREMQEANHVYRQKNYPTNVLSFVGDAAEPSEILLCPAVIRKDAKKYGITFKEELAGVFVHGLLHVLGYGHSNARQRRLMEQKARHYSSLFV